MILRILQESIDVDAQLENSQQPSSAGATGLAQCTELVRQLRGQAGDRQVEGARIGLQHNLGLGGACVVSLYERQH